MENTKNEGNILKYLKKSEKKIFSLRNQKLTIELSMAGIDDNGTRYTKC